MNMESDDDVIKEEPEIIEGLECDDSNDSGISTLKHTKRRSRVWDHFKEIVDNGTKYAECKHCHK